MKLDKRLIGIRIMQRRKLRGLTQEELSEKLDLSKNHISGIERGKYLPTTQVVAILCNILGETPDYYLIGKISDETEEIVGLIRMLPADKQAILLHLIEAYLKCIE